MTHKVIKNMCNYSMSCTHCLSVMKRDGIGTGACTKNIVNVYIKIAFVATTTISEKNTSKLRMCL